MKILILLTLFFAANVQAAFPKAQSRQTPLGTLQVSMIEREEAEPVSKPNALLITIKCNSNLKQKKEKIEIPTCGSALDDVKVTSSNVLHVSHFVWDAVKTSESLEGDIICDKSKRIKEAIKLSDFCSK